MKAIVTLTMNPTIDITCVAERVLPDRKLHCGAPRYYPGGGGINVARAVRNLGGAATAVYASGGYTGRLLDQLLRAEGVNATPVACGGLTREDFMVTEDATGQQFRFDTPGPGMTEEEVERCLWELASAEADYIVASGSLPPGAPDALYARVAELGRKKGAAVLLDSSGDPLCRAVDRGGLFLVKPNLRELGEIAGRELEDEAQIREAADALVRGKKAENVVVSLGGGGLYWTGKEGSGRWHAPAVRIRSRVGAGDSMTGGIVYFLAAGKGMREAVLFGLACGTATVLRPGTELCRREDVVKIFRELTEEARETAGRGR